MRVRLRTSVCCTALVLWPIIASAQAADKPAEKASKKTAAERFGNRPIMTDMQWKTLDSAVDRGLVFISQQQRPDGSFPAADSGQPAVTALCVIALLSRGHIPNEGPYGKQMVRAIEYVLDSQEPDGTLRPQNRGGGGAFLDINYNHAIAGLMLGEAYGMAPGSHTERMRTAIELALKQTRRQQTSLKRNPKEKGGWRYTQQFDVNDADLSVTAWELMFLRSARNAEFDVPKEWIDEGMSYVRHTFDPKEKAFRYALEGNDAYVTRGMAGAGIVALALGGEHNSDIAKNAGDYILRNGFERYNRFRHQEDRYHYGAYYCGQAMFQLGGDYWFKFFPGFLDVLTKNQNEDGSWALESHPRDQKYGQAYTTAMAVLALTPPYQLLPIYQR